MALAPNDSLAGAAQAFSKRPRIYGNGLRCANGSRPLGLIGVVGKSLLTFADDTASVGRRTRPSSVNRSSFGGAIAIGAVGSVALDKAFDRIRTLAALERIRICGGIGSGGGVVPIRRASMYAADVCGSIGRTNIIRSSATRKPIFIAIAMASATRRCHRSGSSISSRARAPLNRVELKRRSRFA